jgi:hypothetical protein
VLNNSAWLKHAWHQAEVRTAIDKRAVHEESIRFGPEAIRVKVSESDHFIGAIS